MSKKKASLRREKPLTVVGNPEALKPKLKQLGGSQSDDWNQLSPIKRSTHFGLPIRAMKPRIVSSAQQAQRS